MGRSILVEHMSSNPPTERLFERKSQLSKILLIVSEPPSQGVKLLAKLAQTNHEEGGGYYMSGIHCIRQIDN